jgi:hypothetical protein
MKCQILEKIRSIDCWTLSNLISLLGVTAYYLDNSYINQTLIVGLKILKGPYSREYNSQTPFKSLRNMTLLMDLDISFWAIPTRMILALKMFSVICDLTFFSLLITKSADFVAGNTS